MAKFAALILCLTAIASASKTPISLKTEGKVRFAEPMLPIRLWIVQTAGEDGPNGATVCEVKAKRTEVKDEHGKTVEVIQTALKCGDREFVVKGIEFGETGK